MDYKVIEHLGKPTGSWKGDAYFFRVYPPEHYNDPNSSIEPTTEFFIVSKIYKRDGTYEIMMFPAYDNGTHIVMHEMYAHRGSFGITHWLEMLGFHFVGDFKP